MSRFQFTHRAPHSCGNVEMWTWRWIGIYGHSIVLILTLSWIDWISVDQIDAASGLPSWRTGCMQQEEKPFALWKRATSIHAILRYSASTYAQSQESESIRSCRIIYLGLHSRDAENRTRETAMCYLHLLSLVVWSLLCASDCLLRKVHRAR